MINIYKWYRIKVVIVIKTTITLIVEFIKLYKVNIIVFNLKISF